MGTHAFFLGANRARNAQRAYWLTLEPRGWRFCQFALDHTRQVTTKTNSNAVNGGAFLPVLVVGIPTSANMLNTCTALSNRVGLRSTTSSQPMVYAPMHALFALSLTITSLTRPRVITRRARCASNRSCVFVSRPWLLGEGEGPRPHLPVDFLLDVLGGQRRRTSSRQVPPPARVAPTPTPAPACALHPHACVSRTHLAISHRPFPHAPDPILPLTFILPSPYP